MERLLQVLKITNEEPGLKICKGIEAYEFNYQQKKHDSFSFLMAKAHYETQLKFHPNDHKLWFQYVLFVEAYEPSATQIRDKYKRATAQIPRHPIKDEWRVYISIWIAYAFYEELKMKDIKQARRVYQSCLGIIPHTTFTFSKIWLMYAQFEQRNNNLITARAILNQAVAVCPSRKIFEGSIKMETELGEFDKCRILYRDYLNFQPKISKTWIDFAKMEVSVGEYDLAHTILSLALNQSRLDAPELIRKAYDEFANEYGSPSSMNEYPWRANMIDYLVFKTSDGAILS